MKLSITTDFVVACPAVFRKHAGELFWESQNRMWIVALTSILNIISKFQA